MVRMLILYLLMEGSRSGYDLKRILAQPYISYWFSTEDPSIYSALKTLARSGYAKAKREGRATKYRITRKGVEDFEAAVREAWVAGEGRMFEAALAVTSDLPQAELAEAIDGRTTYLTGKLQALEAIAPGALSELLVRRERALLAAELDWLADETGRLEHGG